MSYTDSNSLFQLLESDPEARKHAPQVLKDSIKNNVSPPKPQSRPFSTYAARRRPDTSTSAPGELDDALLATFDAASLSRGNQTQHEDELQTISENVDEAGRSYKFPLPTLPLPRDAHKDHRYDPVVKQVTNLLMRHGKLGVAQSNMTAILEHLRTAPAPTYGANVPMLPGARTSP